MNARQVPNLITFSRILLAIVAFWFLSGVISGEQAEARQRAAFFAFWFYFVAAVSDSLDGFLARRYDWVSALGRVADPVADKLLTLGALIYLAVIDGMGSQGGSAPAILAHEGDLQAVMPAWAVVVVLAREFLVTAIRGLVERHDIPFPADRFGKAKMVLQSAYVLIMLGYVGAVPDALGMEFLYVLREPWLVTAIFWAMIAMTAWSGINYSIKAARLLRGIEW